MKATSDTYRVAIQCALVTVLCLIGSFIVGGIIGSIVHGGLPGHMSEDTKIAFAALPALIAVIAGGAWWGKAIARITRIGNEKRMRWAGALGYGPTVILAGIALSVGEMIVVERRMGPDLPIHNVFTLLFVPAVIFIAGIGALALGIALEDFFLAQQLAVFAGLAAGSAFLIVDLAMDAFGYRVGAPGAAERATMLTVLFVSDITAAFAGGAAIGYVLARQTRK